MHYSGSTAHDWIVFGEGSTIELRWNVQEDAGSAYGAVYDMQLGAW